MANLEPYAVSAKQDIFETVNALPVQEVDNLFGLINGVEDMILDLF